MIHGSGSKLWFISNYFIIITTNSKIIIAIYQIYILLKKKSWVSNVEYPCGQSLIETSWDRLRYGLIITLTTQCMCYILYAQDETILAWWSILRQVIFCILKLHIFLKGTFCLFKWKLPFLYFWVHRNTSIA